MVAVHDQLAPVDPPVQPPVVDPQQPQLHRPDRAPPPPRVPHPRPHRLPPGHDMPPERRRRLHPPEMAFTTVPSPGPAGAWWRETQLRWARRAARVAAGRGEGGDDQQQRQGSLHVVMCRPGGPPA